MEPEGGADRAAIHAALVAWRRKAADAFMAVSAAAHLPLIAAVMLGHGPPTGPIERALGLTAYLVIAATALLRRVGYRTRLCACFSAGYFAVALAALAFPDGPYAQVGLVALPIFALVLLGSRATRIAILTSGLILVSASFARVLPGVARVLALDPAQADPPDVVWFQAAVVAAFLVCLMVMLDRFHAFLRHALAAQCRATADLEREAAERSAAQREKEHEVRERRRLEREIAGIGDGERRRLGQELHDGVCQQVTAALLRCQALEQRLDRGGTVSGADFAPLSSLLAQTRDDAHNIAVGLCPLQPDPEALAPALRALTRRTQELSAVRCEFLSAGDVRVPDPAMAQHLYRIAQEGLSNAVRHAHASGIIVELRGSDHDLILQVEDDGAGLPAEFPAGGMGLRTMAYRAQILEGELTITPAPGGGTRVACRVPRLAGAPAAPHPSGERAWAPLT